METYFASPERADTATLESQIRSINRNPSITKVMCSIQGLLAVLNTHRQILAVNNTLFETLRLGDVADVVGLRPGEAINCVHSGEMPGGCGTSRYCKSCGAVISIVLSLSNNEPVDKRCVISVKKGGKLEDCSFSVRACPVEIGDERFVLLFMRETTEDERRASLERAFFHDVNNIVNGLNLASELLMDENETPEQSLAKDIHYLVRQLKSEIDIHRAIAQHDKGQYNLALSRISLANIVNNLNSVIEHHPSALGKRLEINNHLGAFEFFSDLNLVSRILLNMLLNAFEASEKGEKVVLTMERDGDEILFKVWNAREMPSDIALRIFQYQFSTKGENGRGIGTYSMKLLGEGILNGKVGFTTSQQGTEFYLMLPLSGQD